MEKHNLITEFPLQKQKIHDLKVSDHHFRTLFDEYDAVEGEIHHIESGAAPATDMVLTELRKKRVHLKDQIAGFLK